MLDSVKVVIPDVCSRKGDHNWTNLQPYIIYLSFNVFKLLLIESTRKKHNVKVFLLFLLYM